MYCGRYDIQQLVEDRVILYLVQLGTKLEKRLARGDKGINGLDEACKEHDIAYSKEKDLKRRHEADKILSKKALRRVFSSDSKFSEKLAALGVAGAMKAKVKLGMGYNLNNSQIRGRKSITTLKSVIKQIKKNIHRHKPKYVCDAIAVALRTIGKVKKENKPGSCDTSSKKRRNSTFKTYICWIKCLGTAGIVKAIGDVRNAKEQLEESQRHNKTMESIAMGKGLYMKPYKSGLGLFLKPAQILKKLPIALPRRALTNIEILKYTIEMALERIGQLTKNMETKSYISIAMEILDHQQKQ
ncbi:hypothetical protein NQ318_023591 [Aromia moschata]|uniref:Phospholipase A2-like domain-containing protein n=1 Tax=Aromia moschata TaxID=1265417 RepID=A0AAV8YNX2_9CUCU|nr:hypothetical protein NQ318_023591 [Aromia moschata]